MSELEVELDDVIELEEVDEVYPEPLPGWGNDDDAGDPDGNEFSDDEEDS